MTPGPVEEAGKVATGFMEVMKTQPLALALVLMNIALLALFWFIIDRIDTRNASRENIMHEEQMQIRDLLSKCVVPEKRGEYKLQSDESHPVELK